MEPVSSLTAAVLFGPTIQDFLKRVAGPAADEIGAAFGDAVHRFRVRNLSVIIEHAAATLDSARIDPKSIPLKTLIPLLEGASREDNASLADLWAALLANAAAGDQAGLQPILAIILAQLTPFDAKLLAELSAAEAMPWPPDPTPPTGPIPPERWGARRADINRLLGGTDPDDLEVSLTSLSALGLIENEPAVRADQHGIAFMSSKHEFRLSALGRRFIAACTSPSAPRSAH